MLLTIPLTTPLGWIIPLLAGFIASAGLTPVARMLAIRLDIVDRPASGKVHTRTTALMGGTAMFVAFAFAVLLVLPARGAVLGVVLGGLAAVTVGLLDERYSLPPLMHLAGQVVAAVITVVTGVGVVRTISAPSAALTSPGIKLPLAVGTIFTIMWLVGMMNTVNFLDGLDGLAAGVVALSAGLLAVWTSEPSRFFLRASENHEDLLMPLALVGVLLGFLLYNWHPARIFMGDSGSMFLGITLGTLSIVGPAKLVTALLVLMIPVLDVAWAILRRRLSGRNFLSGDKQHVYHRMLELGLSHTRTVLLLYFLCFVLGALDLLLFKIAKLVAFVVLATVTIAVFIALEVRASRRGPRTGPGEPYDESEDDRGIGMAGKSIGDPVFPEIQDGEKDQHDPPGHEYQHSVARNARDGEGFE